jgi:hypothetical protein
LGIKNFTPPPIGTSPKMGGRIELSDKWLLDYRFQRLCMRVVFLGSTKVSAGEDTIF